MIRAEYWGGASENVRTQISCNLSLKFGFFSETKLYGQKMFQGHGAPCSKHRLLFESLVLCNSSVHTIQVSKSTKPWHHPRRNKYDCNLCGHLQRCQVPDIENSRKRWRVGQPKNSRKNSRNTLKTAVLTVFQVFRLFFRLLSMSDPSAPFSAVFRLFSMSGVCTSVDGRRDCKITREKNIKITGFLIFSLLNYESESERKFPGF